jgi:hypothetical protein
MPCILYSKKRTGQPWAKPGQGVFMVARHAADTTDLFPRTALCLRGNDGLKGR